MEKPAPADEPIHDLLRRRWSPRAFSDRPVDRGQVRLLLEAARWAASSYNEQPWAFIVASRDEKEEFQRLLSCLVPGNQAWARLAPLLLLTVAKLSFEKDSSPNRHAFHDVGQAVAQLTLEATALGLRVHQMAGFDSQKAREAYGIPAGFEPVAAIAVGYPGDPQTLPDKLRDREKAERRRKTLREFVFSGAFGKPAELTAAGAPIVDDGPAGTLLQSRPGSRGGSMASRVSLLGCQLFQGLPSAVIARIETLATEEKFPSGTTIFSEGDPARHLYILADGEVELTYVLPGRTPLHMRIAHVRPGEVFAWSALAQGEKLTSNAQSLTDSTAYVIPAGRLIEVMDLDPASGYLVMTRLAQLIAGRLRDTRSELRWIQSSI